MNLLIIGVRRKCYQAAIRLGHQVILWSDGPLHPGRKKKLKDWIEVPYSGCSSGLTNEVQEQLRKHKIDRVIANTEEVVVLGSRVRRFLGLPSLAVDVVERFHNKFVMKNCVKEIGIPITRYQLVTNETVPEDLVQKLGLPLVLKPIDDSGARDVQVLRSLEEVTQSVRPGLLAEAFVEGSELSVETFIRDGKVIFHNLTEYLHQWKKSVAPADLDPGLKAQVLDLNDRVIQHLGVDRGMTHAEFYLTSSGPVFGEVAIRPPGGYYMELIQRVYGFDPWKVYVQLSCREDPGELNSTPQGFAGVMLLHPGEGEIEEVQGEDLIRGKLSEILDFKIRKKAGDRILPHESTSSEVGHILFWERTRAELMTDIDYIEKNLTFKMRTL